MQQAFRVRIVLVIDIVEKRVVEIVSSCCKSLCSCGLCYTFMTCGKNMSVLPREKHIFTSSANAAVQPRLTIALK